MLTVDGLTLPAPTAMSLNYEQIGRAEITADGSTAADRLAIKRRADIEWTGLDQTDAAQVLNSLTADVFMAVTLPDPRIGAEATLTMRLTELEASLLRVDDAGRPSRCQHIRARLKER